MLQINAWVCGWGENSSKVPLKRLALNDFLKAGKKWADRFLRAGCSTNVWPQPKTWFHVGIFSAFARVGNFRKPTLVNQVAEVDVLWGRHPKR